MKNSNGIIIFLMFIIVFTFFNLAYVFISASTIKERPKKELASVKHRAVNAPKPTNLPIPGSFEKQRK